MLREECEAALAECRAAQLVAGISEKEFRALCHVETELMEWLERC